ncbi:hypothetical protein MG293_000618 [Ovis ammon polii]|uniref:Uncharacterized protein n=1 Tax=Ovis ammon polii TaxID=230172 RepID=A0AAD4UL37_OVIAM|nr:hypothetical protein MG293_000618 [Ovis ammon polii]
MGDEEICCTLLLVTAELRESYGSEVRISDPVLCGNLINTVDNVKGVRVLGGMRMTESKRICALETLPQCAHSSSELLGGRLSRDERWLCSSFGSESEQVVHWLKPIRSQKTWNPCGSGPLSVQKAEWRQGKGRQKGSTEQTGKQQGQIKFPLEIAVGPQREGFPGGADSNESACNAKDLGLISGSGRSPGGQNGYPFQYSCLKNPMG